MALGLAAVSASAGCTGCSDGASPSSPAASGSGALGSAPASNGSESRTVVDLIDALPRCDVDHRGPLIDLGGHWDLGRYAWSFAAPGSAASTTHDGATWAKIDERRVQLNVWLPDPSPVFVSLRAIAREANQVVVSIDGFVLGTLRLTHGAIKSPATALTELPLDPGLHQLTLQFRGGLASAVGPFAEVDWVRLGTPDDLSRTYGAPTEEDVVVSTAELRGVPHRALALRAPGAVRCPVRVPRGGRLRTAVGIRGAGTATVLLRVRRDGQPVELLRQVAVTGGADAAWTDLDIPLDPFASQIVGLELAVAESTGTGRLVFGDPVVAVPTSPVVTTPPAKLAVIVVLSSVERAELPPWRGTPTPHLPTLTKLSRSLTLFDDHRAPSSLGAASMASLVSGLSPRGHRLIDAGARLPSAVPTLASMARGASVRAAFFTGVPATFRPFGFNEAWEPYREYSPVEGRLASAPIDDAAAWLADVIKPEGDARPAVVVVHARGGHPPWELTPTEAATLPPPDYAGYVTPRRAGQVIATIREKHTKLADGDLARLQALHYAALSREDQALGRLVDGLEQAGQWEGTLLVVTSDTSSGRSRLFTDGGELDEEVLGLPLLVHFPGGQRGGERVGEPTEVYDVLRTVLGALAVEPPSALAGRDLLAVAAGGDVEQKPRIAYTEARYSARWGSFVLSAELDTTPKLCALEVDPTCSFDRKALYPMVTQALFRRVAEEERRSARAPAREPATIDSDLAAILKVWGAY